MAQTRQADRDKALSDADVQQRETLAKASVERQDIAISQAAAMQDLLEANTRLTEEVERLTREIHARVVVSGAGG